MGEKKIESKIFCFSCCSKVLGIIYELLGVVAEVHPSEMANYSDKLFKAYRGELKEQVRPPQTQLTFLPLLFLFTFFFADDFDNE